MFRWTDVKQEYDEYVEQSRQMEAEMDATLDQKQSIIKDLRMTLSSLEKENESLKVLNRKIFENWFHPIFIFQLKLQSHGIELANTERQMENFKTERDSLKVYLRQLEQKNDDLERAHRILNESIADFERMLDKAYEKNALLEMEVDEKEMLQEKLQRLMDETRGKFVEHVTHLVNICFTTSLLNNIPILKFVDLKQELNVKTRNPLNGSVSNISESTTLSATIANGAVNNSDIAHEENALNNTSLHNTNLTNNLNNSSAVIPNYGEQHSLKSKILGVLHSRKCGIKFIKFKTKSKLKKSKI